MTNTSRQYTLATSHGLIAVEETGRGDLPTLLIHGNSSCRDVFRNQMNGRLAQNHRLIAFDLPGHGQSGDARHPSRSYTRSGFVDAAIEVLGMLGVEDVVVFGWSLGGHIALEMAPRLAGIRGLMISGTPPVGRSNMADGFIPSLHMRLAGQHHFAPSDVDIFGSAIFARVGQARMFTSIRSESSMFLSIGAISGVTARPKGSRPSRVVVSGRSHRSAPSLL